MKNICRFARNWLVGLSQPFPLGGVLRLPRYFRDWITYNRLVIDDRARLRDLYPCLNDRTTRTPFDAHYLYQGAWLARKLGQADPILHVDVGSSIQTISVVSAIVDTIFVDYRPLHVRLPGLPSVGADVTQLPFRSNSIASLSCLHVIEHVGLGRYGDTLDPQGSVKAAVELLRVSMPGGRLYLSVPVGKERICFNAHRVLNPYTVVKLFQPMRLVSFALITDNGDFMPEASLEDAARCEYGCGLFELSK